MCPREWVAQRCVRQGSTAWQELLNAPRAKVGLWAPLPVCRPQPAPGLATRQLAPTVYRMVRSVFAVLGPTATPREPQFASGVLLGSLATLRGSAHPRAQVGVPQGGTRGQELLAARCAQLGSTQALPWVPPVVWYAPQVSLAAGSGFLTPPAVVLAYPPLEDTVLLVVHLEMGPLARKGSILHSVIRVPLAARCALEVNMAVLWARQTTLTVAPVSAVRPLGTIVQMERHRPSATHASMASGVATS